jgi:hypothetical protein
MITDLEQETNSEEIFVGYFKVDLFHSPAMKKGRQTHPQVGYFNLYSFRELFLSLN